MKNEIINVLAFPRALVRGEIDLEECRHAGNYAPQDRVCRDCYYGAECEWLFSNDECVALENKSLEELEGALEFAVGYVDAHMCHRGHDPALCRCEACSWLKIGQGLIDEMAALDWDYPGTRAHQVQR